MGDYKTEGLDSHPIPLLKKGKQTMDFKKKDVEYFNTFKRIFRFQRQTYQPNTVYGHYVEPDSKNPVVTTHVWNNGGNLSTTEYLIF